MMLFFFFNDTATTEIYTLSLHDALPISGPDRHQRRVLHHIHPSHERRRRERQLPEWLHPVVGRQQGVAILVADRSEEHTSELQSLTNIVCRLLLEKKKTAQLNALLKLHH